MSEPGLKTQETRFHVKQLLLYFAGMPEPVEKPAPKVPPENHLAALRDLGWPQEALQREARLRASLPAQQDRFAELLAAIAG